MYRCCPEEHNYVTKIYNNTTHEQLITMMNGSRHDSGEKARNVVIELPESVKKKLPRDFNIDDIGRIDLREAESIASEDILFINENEILEGLEDFDLIPIKKSDTLRGDEETADDDIFAKVRDQATEKKITDRSMAPAAGKKRSEERDRNDEEYISKGAVDDRPASEAGDAGRGGAPKRVTAAEFDSYDDDGRKWTPLEKMFEGNEPQLTSEKKKPPLIEGYVESDDEYIILDVPNSEFESAITGEKTAARGPASGQVSAATSKPVSEMPAASGSMVPDTSQEEDEVVISIENLQESPKQVKTIGKVEMIPVDDINGPGAQSPGEKISSRRSGQYERAGDAADLQTGEPSGKKWIQPAEHRIERDDVLSDRRLTGKKPAAYETTSRGPQDDAGEVIFFDDRMGVLSGDRGTIVADNDLDKIVSGIVRFDEGPSYILDEAGVEEDRERIAVLTDDLAQVDDEIFVDLDFKYGDEELDYIHTAIAEEDYGSYIREIDEFFGTRGGRTVPTRVELLGMTADEFDTIEDLLFTGEFKDIHLYDRYHLYEFDRGAMEGRAKGSKSCRYLLPAENSIMDIERDSIESDISAGSALIFEEDVEEIKEQLKNRTGKTDMEIAAMFERAMNNGRAAEQPETEAPDAGTVEMITAGEQPGEKESAPENIFDITDRVVILDDKADVERFISGFPEPKQMNIKMLLKYLDGLFEKLPEETIKKFASSDYFELYLKVLNELGV